MADDRREISFPTQTTPGRTELSDDVGARSAYDPPQSPQQASAAAFAAQLTALTSGAVGADATNPVGVVHTVTQTAGFPPVTFHTAGFSYELPISGGTPTA